MEFSFMYNLTVQGYVQTKASLHENDSPKHFVRHVKVAKIE
jgi:hypothetical protein